MLLISCRCFINIPINNNTESGLFLYQQWYLLVIYNTHLQGPFSGAKAGSLWQSVNLLSLPYVPVEADWEAGYDTEIISFQIWFLETKQNVYSARRTVFFQYLRNHTLAFLLSIKLSLDIALSVLWGLTFYLVSSPALLEAHNNPMTWLRSFPGLRQLKLSCSWAAFKRTSLQSHPAVVLPHFKFSRTLHLRKQVRYKSVGKYKINRETSPHRYVPFGCWFHYIQRRP